MHKVWLVMAWSNRLGNPDPSRDEFKNESFNQELPCNVRQKWRTIPLVVLSVHPRIWLFGGGGKKRRDKEVTRSKRLSAVRGPAPCMTL